MALEPETLVDEKGSSINFGIDDTLITEIKCNGPVRRAITRMAREKEAEGTKVEGRPGLQ